MCVCVCVCVCVYVCVCLCVFICVWLRISQNLSLNLSLNNFNVWRFLKRRFRQMVIITVVFQENLVTGKEKVQLEVGE